MLAAFLGCIPVFTIPDGHHTLEDHTELDWPTMSLTVPQQDLAALPAIIRNVSQAEIERMQYRLSCAWRRLWFSSMYGSCLGEDPRTDAFDALLTVLRSRGRQGQSAPAPPPAMCGVGK